LRLPRLKPPAICYSCLSICSRRTAH